MSGRTLLSRPRTRVYDANYNIGESMYRPALDRLDRKYSGRATSPSPRQTSIPRDVADRFERAFADEDLATSRRRAEKHITESHMFDSRGGRIAQRALGSALLENDIDEETASALSRIRANKKVSVVDDSDFDSSVNSISSRRMIDRSEKMLRSVGIDENSRRNLDEDIIIKRRSMRVHYDDDGEKNMTKWTPLSKPRIQEEPDVPSASSIRVKQTRERILDIEDEMAALAEKTAARERRAARLKALVAESAEETEAAQSAMKAVSIRSSRRREQTTLEE